RGEKCRAGPSGSLLSRRPTVWPGRLATSTQLPLEKLNELLTQRGLESGVSGELPNVGLSTTTSLIIPRFTECSNVTTQSSHSFSETSRPRTALASVDTFVRMNVSKTKCINRG